MLEKLERIAGELENRLKRSKILGKTVTLKIKYSDFTLQTRSKTLQHYFDDKKVLLEVAKELLYQEKLNNSVRLLGLSLTNLNTNPNQKEEAFDIQLKLEF
jgi:DNA polymerase-4